MAIKPVVILQCTKCGKRGELEKDFGIRNMGDGTARSQAQCRLCRIKASAKAKEKERARR
jgi:hypothetical protein